MTRILDHSGIDEIMQEFNFERVEETMRKLDWQWHGKGVPSIAQIKATSKMLLDYSKRGVEDIVNIKGKKKASYLTGTGGLEVQAEVYKDTDKVYYSLKFIVSQWSNYE